MVSSRSVLETNYDVYEANESAVGEFRQEVIPLLQSGIGHSAQIEAALKRGMQAGKLECPECGAARPRGQELIDSPDGPDYIKSSGHRANLACSRRTGIDAGPAVRATKFGANPRRSGVG